MVIAPAAVIFLVLFILPTVASFYFSLTYWDPFEARFAGWDNYVQFFSEPFLVRSTVNTLMFADLTSGLKTVLGLLLAVLLTSTLARSSRVSREVEASLPAPPSEPPPTRTGSSAIDVVEHPPARKVMPPGVPGI